MKDVRAVLVSAKAMPRLFHAVVPFMRQCVDAAWAGYMLSDCTCIDDSSTVNAAGTFRMGASWASQLPDDVANLADLDD